jgi:hypothetical protein
MSWWHPSYNIVLHVSVELACNCSQRWDIRTSVLLAAILLYFLLNNFIHYDLAARNITLQWLSMPWWESCGTLHWAASKVLLMLSCPYWDLLTWPVCLTCPRCTVCSFKAHVHMPIFSCFLHNDCIWWLLDVIMVVPLTQVLPVLFDVLNEADLALREDIFQQLTKLVAFVKQHIRQAPSFSPECQVVSPETKLSLCLYPCLSCILTFHFRRFLPDLIQLIHSHWSTSTRLCLQLLSELSGSLRDDFRWRYLCYHQVIQLAVL